MSGVSPVATRHDPWCVRPGHTGQCSEKRGHWDRSTNTWSSDLTDENRRMIKQALIRWRRHGQSRAEVIAWVQTHPGFEKTRPSTLSSWLMVYRKQRARGKKWPI